MTVLGSAGHVHSYLSPAFSFHTPVCMYIEDAGEGGDLSFDLKGRTRRGSCRTDYYNVGFRVLRELLDLCASNGNSSASLSVSLSALPSIPPSMGVCRSRLHYDSESAGWGGEGPMRKRTSSKLHILLSPGCFWEYLRMPEGRAAAACRGAGADSLKARGAAQRRRGMELATPVR